MESAPPLATGSCAPCARRKCRGRRAGALPAVVDGSMDRGTLPRLNPAMSLDAPFRFRSICANSIGRPQCASELAMQAHRLSTAKRGLTTAETRWRWLRQFGVRTFGGKKVGGENRSAGFTMFRHIEGQMKFLHPIGQRLGEALQQHVEDERASSSRGRPASRVAVVKSKLCPPHSTNRGQRDTCTLWRAER